LGFFQRSGIPSIPWSNGILSAIGAVCRLLGKRNTTATKSVGPESNRERNKMAHVRTPFISDVQTLRDRARRQIGCGAVTSTYSADVAKTIEILQQVLATEIVCV